MSGKNGSIQWSHHMSGDNGSPWGAAEGLTLDNGVIYTSSSVSGGYIYAFRARDGAILWHTPVHPEGSPSTPTLGNGVIYVSVTDASLASSHIYAFKAINGTLLWRSPIQGCGSPPILVGSSLYLNAGICTGVGQQKGHVYALNAGNGSIRWQYPLDNSPLWKPVVLNGIVYSDGGSTIYAIRGDTGALLWHKNGLSDDRSPLAGTGNVLSTQANGSLYGLRASDGKQLWQAHIGNLGPYEPTIIGNTIYAISSYDTAIYALRLQDGATLWSYDSQDFPAGSFPLVDNGVVYFSMIHGTIFELAASDGTPIVTYTLNDVHLWTHAPLAVGA
ncbi:MAG: PQQ-binding-like beta-propeller repeat protein [Chloroflexota bacterium]|nr:PQQ-binding-like beta-propeller repeat protein [Chloroflexota bacterium]